MPDTTNQGVRIHYEVAGEGRPIVLLHGWLADLDWWTDTGFVEGLRGDHRVISIDLRGHGQSDKPHDPASYRSDRFVSDVLAVADAEGLDRFAIWGLSYGGWVGWLTAHRSPERIPALISTGSWDPRPVTYEDWVTYTQVDLDMLEREGMSAVVDRYEEDAFTFPGPIRARMLEADQEAMVACQSSELLSDGLPTLEGFPVPVLLISGEFEDPDDDAAKIAGMIPRGESLRLPGLGHAGAGAASGVTIPTARAFLDRWFA